MSLKHVDNRAEFKTAFTLIELLVVIAIISLLISILLPSLTEAKRLARRTQCAVQLHSIGSALAMYSSDYEEYPPLGVTGSDNINQLAVRSPYIYATSSGRKWGLKLLYDEELLQNYEVLECPSNDRYAANWPPYQGDGSWYWGTYSYWVNMRIYDTETNEKSTNASANIQSPAEDIAVTDLTSGPYNSKSRTNHLGHDGECSGSHSLFMDLHVEWIDNEDLTTIKPVGIGMHEYPGDNNYLW